jgi:hypothetical protein
MSLVTCADCSAAYPGELSVCPQCRSTSRGGSVLPAVEVECRNQACRAAGTVRRVGLRTAAPGVVELPAFLCSGCGLAMYLVSMWRQPAAGTEKDMPRIHADREPTYAPEAAAEDDSPAEVPVVADPPPAEPEVSATAPPDYSALTVDQLRGLLAERDLSRSGTKVELISRLQESDAATAGSTGVTITAEAAVTRPDGSTS